MAELPRILVAAAWVLVGIAGLLVFASVSGNGAGFFGSGALAHPAWTMAIFGAVLAVGLWVLCTALVSRSSSARDTR